MDTQRLEKSSQILGLSQCFSLLHSMSPDKSFWGEIINSFPVVLDLTWISVQSQWRLGFGSPPSLCVAFGISPESCP